MKRHRRHKVAETCGNLPEAYMPAGRLNPKTRQGG